MIKELWYTLGTKGRAIAGVVLFIILTVRAQ